jgi:hypothetical protein
MIKIFLSFSMIFVFLATLKGNAQIIQHLDAELEASVIRDSTELVSAWQDQSGEENHAIASSGKIYYLKGETEDEKSWLNFGSEQNKLELFSAEASDEWLDQSSGTRGFCILMAFKINGIVSNWNDLIGNSTAVGQGFGLRYGNSGNIHGYLGGKTINKGGNKLSVGDIVIYAFNYDATSGSYEFWDSKNGNSASGTVSAKDFSLNAPVTLGATSGDSRLFNGWVGEVKVYNNALNSSDFKAQRDSLSMKWGEFEIPAAINWRVIPEDERFPTEDLVIAAMAVDDHDLNNSLPGDPENTDCTATFQEALHVVGNSGGGTVFIPEGHYRFDGTLLVPGNVTLRGRWSPLSETNPASGTILKIYNGRNNEDGKAFITIEGSGGVRDITFWHPEQTPENITPYPFVIQPDGGPITIENITLVNAYKGVNMSSASMCFMDNIQGTALHTGFFADKSYAVSRFDKLIFGPEFWKWAKLPESTPLDDAYESYIRTNGLGIDIREMDGFHLTESKVRGMNIGLRFDVGITGDNPHGDISGLDFRDCEVALQINSAKSIKIVNSILQGNETGLKNLYNKVNLKVNSCNITGEMASVQSSAGGILSVSSCILDGKIVSAGDVNITGCEFKNSGVDVDLNGQTTGALIYGCAFADGPHINDNSPSSAKVIIENESLSNRYNPAPKFPSKKMNIRRKPSKNDLFIVTDYGAIPNDGMDDSQAFQQAIDSANANQGGIVFFPYGNYDLSGSYTLESGVELRGINGSRHNAKKAGPGSMLQITGNEGSPNGEPFLILNSNCGIRGLVFFYPSQEAKMLLPETIIEYPFTVRGTGDDIYITDCQFTNPYQAVNFVEADNHLLENCLMGGLNKTIYVQNCDSGRVENFHLKPDFWRDLAIGDYPVTGTGTSQLKRYVGKYLHGIWLKNSTNQVVHNIFNHASHQFLRVDNSTGLAYQIGGEQLQRGYRFSGNSNFNLVLSNSNINNQGDRGGSYGNWADENFSGKANAWMCGVEGTADKAYWIQAGEYDSRQNSIGGSGNRGVVNLEVNEGGILNLNAFSFGRKLGVDFNPGSQVAIQESSFEGLPNHLLYDTTVVLERNIFKESYIVTDLNQNWIVNDGLVLDTEIKFEDSPMFGTGAYDARVIKGARSEEGEFVLHVEDKDFLNGNNNPLGISTYYYIDSNSKIDVYYNSTSGRKLGKTFSYNGQTDPKYWSVDFSITDAHFTGVEDIVIKITGDSPLLNYVYISRPISEINLPPVWSDDTLHFADAISKTLYSEPVLIGTDISDPEGDDLSFLKISGPSWIQVSSSGQLYGTPAGSDEGINHFVVQASDGKGNKVRATLIINVEIPTGIPVIDEKELKVYPVPANDILRIKGIEGNADYQILSMSGIIVKEGKTKNNSFSIKSLLPGSYILKLENKVVKIIKI